MLQGVCEPLLAPFQFSGNFFVLLLEHVTTPQSIDSAPLRRLHQPRPRIFRNTFLRPQFEGSDESVLGQLLCNADIACDASNRGDEPRRLNLPHGLNRLMDISHAYLTAAFRRSNPSAPFKRLLERRVESRASRESGGLL